MAEISYPVLNTSVSEAEWQVMAQMWGSGIIDNGGSPYNVVSVSDATNEITIGRDSVLGYAEAMLNGFVHRMDTDKTLTVPTAAATYEIGLVYDPAGYGTAAGPVKLDIWTQPGDYTNGKKRLIMYRIVRSAGQALSAANRIATFMWTVPTIMVANTTSMGYHRAQDHPFGTRLYNYGAGKLYRANGSSWTEIQFQDPDVAEASGGIDPLKLVRRGLDGGFLVPTAVNSSHPIPLSQADGKYAYKSHNHSGSNITSGVVPYDRIDGSTHAYNNTNTGSTWSSIVARNTGEFARYPSALKYKTDVTPWEPTMEDVLSMKPVHYYGKQSGDEHIGIVADYHAGTSLDLLVEYGADEEGNSTDEVEGFRYMLMPVAQQVAILNHEERIKSLEKQVAELTALVRGLTEQK